MEPESIDECKSPPFFCTASETGWDIIQQLWDTKVHLERHAFENKMEYDKVVESLAPDPVTVIEVYVDDYIVAKNNRIVHFS